MDEPDLSERIKRFTSLRSGQRALARWVHPSQLVSLRRQGRDLLLRLQGLSAEASEAKKDQFDAHEHALGWGAALADVDDLIAEQTKETLDLVLRLEFDQLQGAGRRIARDHPGEVASLIDVMLRGNLDHDKLLRLLEYLLTMLCFEEWGGRLTMVCEASEATPGLRELTSQLLDRSDIDPRPTVQRLQEAQVRLVELPEPARMRDEVREFKRSLGRQILHPHILDAVVSYNAEMWNRVAAQVETAEGFDELADELLADLTQAEGATEEPNFAASEPPRLSGLRSSAGFRRIVDAVAIRLSGDECADAEAFRVASRIRLSGLRPVEAASLSSRMVTSSQALVRDAIVLAGAIHASQESASELKALGLDPQALKQQALVELMDQMSAEARDLFRQSRYDEASLLCEVKTRNLTPLLAAARQLRGQSQARPGKGSRRFLPDLTLGQPIRLAGVAVSLGLFALLLLSFPSAFGGRTAPTESVQELVELSPFLVAGRHDQFEGGVRFVGEVGASWAYLGTAERREVAVEIAERLRDRGIDRAVLHDSERRLMAAVLGGKLEMLVPRPGEAR